MRAIISWVGWNMFLALIPLGAAYFFSWLFNKDTTKSSKVFIYLKYFVLIIIFLIWLAFLPNTCYLITEWRHLLSSIIYSSDVSDTNVDSNRDLLVWFAIQMLFYILYSGVGMMLFVLSSRPMWRLSKLLKIKFVAIPFFLLNALGVYLGLIPRFNSWDILHRPSVIINEVIKVATTLHLLELVIGLAVFLWLVYIFFDIWIDGFNRRTENLKR